MGECNCNFLQKVCANVHDDQAIICYGYGGGTGLWYPATSSSIRGIIILHHGQCLGAVRDY